MNARSIVLAAGALAVFAPAAYAGGDDYDRARVLAEMHQVRTGDYSYQVGPYGQIIPRYRFVGTVPPHTGFYVAPLGGVEDWWTVERRRRRDR
jgi:hypothetical protein